MALCPLLQAPVTDEALVRRARTGERGAFVTLLLRHQAQVHRFAMRISRNASDADEITQETFLRAFRGISAFRGESRITTWLSRIALTEWLMRQRASRRRPTFSLEAARPHLGHPDDPADELLHGKWVALQVRGALDDLDEKQRDALVLRDLEELSAHDAGEILGVSAPTVRQRARRAKLRLRDSLSHLAQPSQRRA